MVYREGEESNHIFIIKSGEFEVTKRFIKAKEKKQIDVFKLLGPNHNANDSMGNDNK